MKKRQTAHLGLFLKKTVRKIHFRTWVALGILVVIFPVVALSLFRSQNADAAWFNDNWAYRKKVPITAHTGAETNKYFSVTVDTSDTTKFQSDCGDIRFTDNAGTLLQYYISSGCSGASTVIHVLVPTFPAGATDYYMYYGNPNAVNGFSSADFTAGTSVTVGTVGAEQAGSGPLLYWSLNDGSGSTAYDSTFSKNNGTVAGTWKSEPFCITGTCLYVTNSSTQGVTTSTVSPFSKLTTGTVSVWARFTGTNRYQDIFNMYRNADTTGTGFKFSFDNQVSGGVNIEAIAYKDGATKWAFSVSSSNFNAIAETGKWHLYTLVHDGTTPSLYIDGKPIPITFTTSTDKTVWFKAFLTDATSKADTFTAGVQFANNTPFDNATGFFDDFKVYSYARSATQIQTDYSSRTSTEGVSAQLGQNKQSLFSDGLVGYWPMDETSWATNCSTASVLDYSGYGNNGKPCPNASAVALSVGKFGKAGSFDGTNDYINLTSTSLDPTQKFTISTWINPTSLASSPMIIGTSSGANLQFGINPSGQLDFYGGSADAVSSVGSIVTGSWQHVVVTYNGAGKYRFYVNGVDVTSTENGDTLVAISTLTIGRWQSNYFVGKIDEVRFYNKMLSTNEISQLTSLAPGPVGYWKADEPSSAADLQDSSGNGTACTINNANPAAHVTGKFGSALSTIYNINHADCSSATVLANMPQMTASAWIYTLDPNANLGGGTDGYNRIMATGEKYFSTGPNNVLSFYVDYATTGLTVITSNNAIPLNQWVHVEATWDGTTSATGVHIYVNGVEATYQTQTNGSGTITAETQNWSLGSTFANNNYAAFIGYLDEMKLYNYPRTRTQILEDMNGNHPIGGSPVGSQLLYWKMDEQNGNTINNSGNGGSTYNGTNSGAAWLLSNNCKVDGCLNFDTTTDNVSAGDLSFIDSLTGFSTSFWLNPQTLATNKMIVSKANNTTQRVFQIKTDDTTAAKLKVMVSSSASDVSNYCVTASSVLTASTWQHVTVVYDGTQTTGNDQRLKVYVNGIPQSCTVTGTISTSLVSGTTSNLKLGQGDDSTPTALLAYIDEFKIYNAALTADQVKIEAQFGSGIDFGTGQNERTQITGSAETAPILYTPLDENSGTTAKDITGNGRDGTLRSTAKYVTGKIGSAVYFDGTNAGSIATASHINFADDILDSLTTESTIETWFKPNSTGTDDWENFIGLSEEGGSNTGKYFEVAYERSTSKVWFYSGWASNCATEIRASVVLSGSQTAWHHFAFTMSSSGNAMYIDGVKQTLTYTLGTSSTSCNFTTWTTGGGGTTKLTIGCWFQTTTCYSNEMFEGALDDFKVYNYARTQAQIAYDYNRGTPIGWWKLDECQGSTVYDGSGNALNGTISIGGTGTQTSVGTCATSSTAWGNGAIGKYNNSLNFDGTDDKVTLTDNALYDLKSSGFYSVSGWIKPSSIGTGNVMFDSDSSTTTAFTVEASTNADSFFGPVTNGIVAAWLNSWGTNGLIAHTKNNVLSTGVWAFVTVTYDGSQSQANRLKIYVNGVDQTDTTDIYSTGTIADISPTATYIGSDTANEYFAGQIDEVRFYNYALSASQVRKLYNNASSVYFGPVQGTPIP